MIRIIIAGFLFIGCAGFESGLGHYKKYSQIARECENLDSICAKNARNEFQKALEILEESCAKHDGKSCALLGNLYDKNLFLQTPAEKFGDNKKAIFYLQKACKEFSIESGCKGLERIKTMD